MLSELLLSLLLVSMDETHTIPGLLDEVVVTIDDRGVPKITGEHRADVVRVQGWMHARDRLFQMDGLRRVSSARLEGLAGPQARGEDDRFRKFRMLEAADEIYAALPEDQRQLLMAYADGVNAGAKAHPKTLEHTILQNNFEPWQPRDSICVLQTMWAALSIERRMELVRGVVSDLGPEIFEFLARGRSHWDAPTEIFANEPPRPPVIPSPEAVNLRDDLERSQARGLVQPVMAMLGSNNWAVSKERSATGYAILANDPHLPLSAPGYWYRADLHWPGMNAMGASQPGLPGATVGATDHLSWGLTNTGGNFLDYAEIKLQRDEEGWFFDTFGPKERLRGAPIDGEALVGLRSTLGPLVEVVSQEEEEATVRFAVWTALRPESANLTQFQLLEAKNVDEGVAVTSTWFGPSQNVVMADASGRIGWTISGFIPKRVGFDGSTPVPWSADCRWDWGAQAPRPSVVDPDSGVLYTANNRVAGWEYAPAIGENWDPGYRASRIRDLLAQKQEHDEQSLLAIALDTRVEMMDAWYQRFTKALQSLDGGDAGRARNLSKDWNGTAAADSRSYVMVQAFREVVEDALLSPLVAPVAEAMEVYQSKFPAREEAVEAILRTRPLHLLPLPHDTWDAFLSDCAGKTIRVLIQKGGPNALAKRWGEKNSPRVAHPIADQLPPILNGLVRLPDPPQSGSMDAVKVIRPGFGASLRMVISPSNHDAAIYHMPGGQSGDPRSDQYRKGHNAWIKGKPTPMRSGPAVRTIRLQPAG